MLQSIRERASGWIAWVIVILISIPFALWGVHEYFGTDPNPPVASVNGEEIPQRQFQRAYMQQRERLRTALGGRYDEAQMDAIALRDSTLEQMVRDEALVQAALAGGMRVSDQQVAVAIRTEQTFVRDGVFSDAGYHAWLRQQGMSSGGFEYQLRRNLLADQLAAGIARTALVPAGASERLTRLIGQRRDFALLTVPRERYRESPVSDAEVAAYYEENRDDFITPERVVARYLLLSQGALAADMDIDEEELRASYERRRGDLATPEQRKVSHILLQVDPDATAEEAEAARERLTAVRERILSGESFADVAAEVSEDPGSSALGGDLGFFARGIMDKSFEDAAFSQEAGVVGEPVRSDFGYHLILVTEVKEGDSKPFEEVREQLLAAMQQERVERFFFEQVDQLANLSFEHPESLQPAADTLGMQIHTSQPFSRQGGEDELFSRPEAVRAAFSEDVLEGGMNSEPVDLGDGRVLVLRVNERLPAVQQSLDEARTEIVTRLQSRAADNALRAAASGLLQELRGGASHADVAERNDLEWRRYEDIGRDAVSVDPLVLQATFRMHYPGAGEVVYDAVDTIGGDFAVIALQSVSSADDAERGPAETQQAVALGRGRQEFAAFVEQVREDAEVEVHQSALANAL